jgi:type I restriction enzyme S subunit
MSSEWQTLTIGQLGRVVTGKTPKTSDPENFGNQIPFVTPTDMDGCKVMATTARYLSEQGASTVKSSIIPAGSVMVSCIGSDMGKSVIAKHRCVTNQQINSVVVNTQFSSEFVYYNLSMRKAELQHLASGGSTMPILNKGMFSEVKIDLPPLAEQLQIVSTLSALDDRITLLRETNATLEAIAQALFKSWFVDFDPVRAKLEGRAPEGMDEVTARLFPDSFKESELGLVPSGWRVGQLGNEVRIAYGKNLPTSKLLESGYPVYGGNGQIGFSDKFLYESRQVLVACRGAASGKFNQSVPRSFVTNNSLVLESSDATPLLFGYLKGCISCADLIPFVTGSAQPQVTIDNLKNFKLLVPSDAAVRAFESFSAPIEDAIEANSQQAQTLATLRDTLLPRLISGQLRLPEAQATFDAALA